MLARSLDTQELTEDNSSGVAAGVTFPHAGPAEGVTLLLSDS